ncbi:MAG: hypothetical protein AAF415_03345 [Pseudomonadota bacterium]
MTLIKAAYRSWLASALILAAIPAASEGVAPEYWEFFGEAELEATGFFEEPQFLGQDRDAFSVAGQFTLLAEWLDGDLEFRFTPFARWDNADDRRTHADVRELKVDYATGDWSFTFGADTVFWGKTEVVHLVDIINQTDQVENIDDEDRLGQPMLRVAYLTDIGEFSAFALPFFRERPFPGVSGRLRFATPVNTAQPIFETDAEEWTPSFAVRYSGVIGNLDLGISGFHGLSRDPSFFFDGVSLRPVYSRINQAGIDAQYTSGATLWKFEGIFRDGQRNALGRFDNFVSFTGGFEHTLFGVFDSTADLGLITEYAFDERGQNALTAFQNDLILGTRLALNDAEDTAFLLTSAFDMNDGAVALRLEGETRLSDNLKLELEGQGFVNQNKASFVGSFADDSFFRARLRWFF